MFISYCHMCGHQCVSRNVINKYINDRIVCMFVFPFQTFNSVSWNTSCWRSSYDSDVSEEFMKFGQTLDEEVLKVFPSYLFPEEERATPASCCSSTSSHRDRVRDEEEELLLFEMFKMAIEAEEDTVCCVVLLVGRDSSTSD